jgi:polysaccharide export outer membrane protein
VRIVSAACLAALSFVGCGAPIQQVEQPAVTLQGELALGPGDTFDVRVFGEPDLTGTYRVADDGTIDYPLIGQIKLEGMEPHDAATFVATKLKEKYLRHPQVSILVKEQPSKKINVIGQVAKPGTYAYESNMSIIEAISKAGGFTPIAARNKTTITRIDHGNKVTVEAAVADIGEGRAQNVSLRPGDIISVPERIF